MRLASLLTRPFLWAGATSLLSCTTPSERPPSPPYVPEPQEEDSGAPWTHDPTPLWFHPAPYCFTEPEDDLPLQTLHTLRWCGHDLSPDTLTLYIYCPTCSEPEEIHYRPLTSNGKATFATRSHTGEDPCLNEDGVSERSGWGLAMVYVDELDEVQPYLKTTLDCGDYGDPLEHATLLYDLTVVDGQRGCVTYGAEAEALALERGCQQAFAPDRTPIPLHDEARERP